MRLAVVLAALFVAGPARAQPETRAELDALEKKLTDALATARASVGCVVVSRSDQYPKPAGPPAPAWQLGGFDPAAFRKADPSPAAAELAARLDLSDPEVIPALGAAGGVVIDPAGLVLTTHGAVEGATKIFVHLPAGGSYADIHAADARSDLAVLKLLTPPLGLAAVPPADVRLPEARRGDRRPAGGPTVTPGKLVYVAAPYPPDGRPGGLGVVTAVRRPPGGKSTDATARSYYLQGPTVEFDARADPGCNGAAVLTPDGRLLGLITTAAGYDGDRGRFLPLDDNLSRVVEVLRRGEEVEYGFLGVGAGNDGGGDGVAVSEVTPGGPAEAAGLLPGDRILRINGHPADRFEDVLLHVGSALAGSTITLQVNRGDRTFPAQVTLAKFRNDAPSVASVKPEPVLGLRVEHASVLARNAGFFGSVPAGVPAGVLVREVVPGGPAAAKFQALGEGRWVITKVDGKETPTPTAFRAAAKGKQSARLTVYDPTDPAGRAREITIP
ncbi:MAG: PDZ domain-containing protein [Gemmataceae bacterium]|nr:PDZ domain-containing protein [Gemmataceae bacterium]